MDSCPEPALSILLSHEFLKAKGGGRAGKSHRIPVNLSETGGWVLDPSPLPADC